LNASVIPVNPSNYFISHRQREMERREWSLPRIGSGGPAGTLDHTDTDRTAFSWTLS